MRLFHVSEEADIREFIPRLPMRKDLDPNTGLVWAIDEAHLPNFLTPRNCPRVCYHIGPNTTERDRKRFFSDSINYVVVLEHGWYDAMRNTTLYLYEFAADEFVLQDDVAGYWVATTVQKPIAKYELYDLISEQNKRGVDLQFAASLYDIAREVKESTLNWSICRMAFAQKPENI